MVRGTKRKIEIEKITKKESLAVCFSKRSSGLYSKASQLCLLSGSQIAILATPSSSQSNVSFYSFGHFSVDSVVSAFLAGERPVPAPEERKRMREDVGVCLARKKLGLGFWWDDESLDRSENPEEIKEALESMASVLSQVRSQDNHVYPKKKKKKDHETQPLNQTLTLQSNSAICCVPGDGSLETADPVLDDTEEQNQISDFSENFCTKSDSPVDDQEIVVLDDNSPESFNTEEQIQISEFCENFCNENNSPEMDLDQILDFGTTSDEAFSVQEVDDYAASFLMSCF